MCTLCEEDEEELEDVSTPARNAGLDREFAGERAKDDAVRWHLYYVAKGFMCVRVREREIVVCVCVRACVRMCVGVGVGA